MEIEQDQRVASRRLERYDCFVLAMRKTACERDGKEGAARRGHATRA